MSLLSVGCLLLWVRIQKRETFCPFSFQVLTGQECKHALPDTDFLLVL